MYVSPFVLEILIPKFIKMWQKSSFPIDFQADEVSIWRARLGAFVEREGQFWATLSPDERQRANRFHFPIHRAEFITGRGILRQLLGQYLRQSPAALIFDYGPQNKPFLPAFPSLAFNISHSGGLALFAFAHNLELGVDLERINPKINALDISQHFFAPQERAQLASLSGSAQIRAFFTCWTRKEAFIKAKGQGLSLPLDQFEVSLLPNQAPQLLHTHWNPEEAAHWHLYSLAPGPQFTGALAVNRAIKAPLLWEFAV